MNITIEPQPTPIKTTITTATTHPLPLSPLDGIGPQDIGLDILDFRLQQNEVTEVILATNPTVEGEATAQYIAELCHVQNVNVTRIAHGVPVGGELELVDGTTLSHSLLGRHKF